MKTKVFIILSTVTACVCCSTLLINNVLSSSCVLLENDTEALSLWECVDTGGVFKGVCCDLNDGTGKMCIDLPGNEQPRDCTTQTFVIN